MRISTADFDEHKMFYPYSNRWEGVVGGGIGSAYTNFGSLQLKKKIAKATKL